MVHLRGPDLAGEPGRGHVPRRASPRCCCSRCTPRRWRAWPGHSGYKGDPWGRLQRTSHYLAVTTFGTVTDAEEAIAHVRSVHRRVRGKDELGRPYAADDPHLLRWVHVAEIWSFLNAFQTYGAEPLTAAEADLFVEQTNRAASRLGATDLPTTVAELDEVIEGYRPELQARPLPARRRASCCCTRRSLWWPDPGYALIAAGGVALLPDWARRALSLRVHGPGLTAATRAGAMSTAMVRWGMAGLRDASTA